MVAGTVVFWLKSMEHAETSTEKISKAKIVKQTLPWIFFSMENKPFHSFGFAA